MTIVRAAEIQGAAMIELDEATGPIAKAYRAYVSAKIASYLGRSGSDPRQQEKAIWRPVYDALRAYEQPGNREPFPAEMAFAIAEALEAMLDTGHLPPAFKALSKNGSSGRGNLETKHATIMAARYMLEVRARRINDPTPNKTVRKAFGGISEALVRQWVKKYRAEAEADMRLVPLDREEEKGLVLKQLLIEGQKYQHFGRKQRPAR
jgi:hypothetical protein